MNLAEYVRGLPKAELHMHIEGTLEPEMLFELAQKNDVELPYASVAEVRAAYEFDDLQSFLDIYYAGAAVLVTEDDFAALMRAYLDRAIADGVRHAEMFFDPQTHTQRGIDIGIVIRGFRTAMAEYQDRLSTGLIMCFLRHLGGEEAVATFEAARPYLGELMGVGLDSSEVGFPPELFVDAYALAKREGLRLTAHAAEEAGPGYVWGALNALGAERIDHGVRGEEDDELIDRLVADGIALTMCPISNRKLHVVQHLADHNLKRLMDRGVKVTINSDDPAYFGGYVGDNYVQTAEALGLTRDDLAQIARNSIEASFLDEGGKAELLAELAAYVG